MVYSGVDMCSMFRMVGSSSVCCKVVIKVKISQPPACSHRLTLKTATTDSVLLTSDLHPGQVDSIHHAWQETFPLPREKQTKNKD